MTPPPPQLSTFTSAAGEQKVRAAYATVLAHWSAPYTEHLVPTSFGEVHVVASGPEDAPPIVLLAAFFATAGAWYRSVGELSRRHRVYAIDILGEANPSRPTRPVRTADEFADCFEQLLDALGVERADLVGNSFGGFLAAQVTVRLPERIRSLTLISP